MLRLSVLLLTVSLVASCTAPSETIPEVDLETELLALISDFEGDVGIYVEHLANGQTVAINADTLFPTASMIKVPILLKTFDAIERGDLDYRQKLVYRDSLLYPGDDLIGAFRDSAEVELAKVAMLMITTSDNTGSLWLQHLSGTGTSINEWLEDNSFEHTRVNSRTPGRRPNWEVYGWGQTTPREMAQLLTMVRRGKAVSPAASEEMYRILTRIYWNKEALSQLPPTVQVASKQGAVSQSRSEVLLVNAPGGDYVVCVITKNQADTSWEPDNAGYVLLRNVSRTVWQHFEPKSNWSPAQGGQEYE
ncbi:MAG: serine hydrolase [Bacteroidota bacterium]